MTESTTELQAEPDEYNALLALLGRTEEQDHRIAIHEAGHAVCARLLGQPLGGATINPDASGKYGGLVWGPQHSIAFGNDDDADVVPELCDKLRTLMPQDGEPRADAAEVYLHALNRCIELAAAAVAERMLLEGEPLPSVSDVEHAIKYASLVCKSPEAIKKFIGLCEIMADDLLRPYGDVVIALSTVLRIKRTLNGREIDEVISDVQARKALAIEQQRREDWRKSELAAARFRAECEPLDAAGLRHCSDDQMSQSATLVI
jgi:hypothetical protein